MTTNKKRKREQEFTIEELYQNKNFVPPKEKNLETIFEEPRQAKSGAPILTSVRKYKRYLDFDPSYGKIKKRKLNMKKCLQKFNIKTSKTGSLSEAETNEINVILENLEDSSNDSDIHQNESDTISKTENLVTETLKVKCESVDKTVVNNACQTECSDVLTCEKCKVPLLDRASRPQGVEDIKDIVKSSQISSSESVDTSCAQNIAVNKGFGMTENTFSSQYSQTENSCCDASIQVTEDAISPSKQPCIVA